MLEDLWRDTGSGHKIVKTVFIECRSSYRETGPDHLKPVGETEFVAEIAAQSAAAGSTKAVIAGIVSHADLTLGDTLDEVLEAHEAAGRGLFRGIRHAGARHPYPEEAFIPAGIRPDYSWMELFKRVYGSSAGAAIPMKVGTTTRNSATFTRWPRLRPRRPSSSITLARRSARNRSEINAKPSSNSGKPISPRWQSARTSTPNSAAWHARQRLRLA